MALYVVKRLGTAVVQIGIVVTTVFFLLRIFPADPARRLVGDIPGSPNSNEAYLLERRVLGLDHSAIDQFGTFLRNLFTRGTFGKSWTSGSAVGPKLLDCFPVTLQLIVLAFALTLLISIPLALLAAANPNSRLDKAVKSYSLFAGSQPEFWWALVFIFVFWFKLRAFPIPIGLLGAATAPPAVHTHFILVDALIDGDFAAFRDVMGHLLLPMITIAFALSGPFVKVLRESVLRVTTADFILYAKAAGLPRRSLRRSLLQNAFAPMLTLVGIYFAASLGGAVLIETVFNLDGLGHYTLEATLGLDYPALQGSVVLLTAFSVLVFLLVDLLHAALDPRVRVGRQ